MNKFLLIVAALFLAGSVAAQSLRSYERAGDEAFRNKNYGIAVQYYGDILKRQKSNYPLWWKYAESARLNSTFQVAQRAYKKIAAAPKMAAKFPLLMYRLGAVNKQLGLYDEAAKNFEQFLSEKPDNVPPEYLAEAAAAITECAWAKKISATPKSVHVKHLGRSINSPWNEFAPTIVGDTLYYASSRFDKKGDRGKDKAKLNKVLFSSKNGRGREPSRGFPSIDSAHIAHTAFTPDGHFMFFTICNDLNATDKRCELWLSVLDRRNRWLPALRLPEPLNVPGYTTTMPSIGYDESVEGPVLWFASDRPGGHGKLDLWSVPLDTNFFCPCNLPLLGKKFEQLPRFEEPMNAVALNTAENDATPFLHGPTQKLYFSSDGWPGLGGYDIFTADKIAGEFSNPQNVGGGLNTSFNDLYFILKPDGLQGYLTSNRTGAYYVDEKTKAACHDIFSFKWTPPVPPTTQNPTDTASLLVGKKPDLPPEVPTLPEVKIPELTDFNGLPLYFDNDEPDKRTRRTSTPKTYETTVIDYLERQEDYRARFAGNADDIRADSAIQIIDDFFDREIRRGYQELGKLCELLLFRLSNGDSIAVLVKGFTSPRAKSDYNLALGKRRVSSVRNQFESWSEGLLKPFLQTGQLQITEVSFGETTARSGISDALDDERNSIYHPDAARERRVEIVEVKLLK